MASVPSNTDPVPIVGKSYPVTFKPFLGKTEGIFTAIDVEPGDVWCTERTLRTRSRITYTVDGEVKAPGSPAPSRCNPKRSRS